jgi:DNA-binding NarL/FixJ family response regulator
MSPYEWDGIELYRSRPIQSEYESQIVHFGGRGSASILQIVHGVPLDSIFDRVVGEHLKFHAALYSTSISNVRFEKTRLNIEERTMISWAAKGLTVKETAKKLGIIDRTVEYRLNCAKVKLGKRTTAGAVYMAVCSKQLDY